MQQCYRVLVVDDNRRAALMLKLLLVQLGHDVEIVSNGRNALLIARRFRPQIVFVDMVLPDIDGCDLVSDLKMALGDATTRYFAITAFGDDHSRTRSAVAGCDDYLVKPVEPRFVANLFSASHSA